MAINMRNIFSKAQLYTGYQLQYEYFTKEYSQRYVFGSDAIHFVGEIRRKQLAKLYYFAQIAFVE